MRIAKLKKYVVALGQFIKANKLEIILLGLILLLGAFLRLYRIGSYLTFLGDEGRDALVVRRLLVDFDLIFVGPGTSVGNMYLGPFYYYLMAPFLLLWNYSPVGPAVMVALFGVATIFLVWVFTRNLFVKNNGIAYGSLLAAFLYSINPTVIKLTRFSWNPNIMPFLSLLFAWSVWIFYKAKNYKALVWAGLLFGIILQSHYMGAVMVLLLIVYYLVVFVHNKKAENVGLIKYTVAALSMFFLTMLPLVIFDAKHDLRNLRAMSEFFLQRKDVISFSLSTFLEFTNNALNNIFRSLFGINQIYEKMFMFALILFVLWVTLTFRKYLAELKKPIIFVGFWCVIGVIGLGLYRKEIYDHYYAFLFPAPFILLGGVFDIERQKKNGFVFIGGALLFSLFLVNYAIQNHPFRNEPNRQLERTKAIAEKMITESKGQPFNFAVISNNNYEGAYQYFLEKENSRVVIIDPQKDDETITQILFVVCEYEDKTQCQPTSNPKAQVANFGWSKIDSSYLFDGIILYKLSHNKP